jgi:hypothetical protein
LYERIDLSKPWDDPANAEAVKSSIPTYCCPEATSHSTRTTYLGVVTPDSCLRPAEPRPLSEIKGNHGEMLMVIEVASSRAVPWMAPTDADEEMVLGFSPETELAHSGGMHALALDGSVRFLSADMPAAERRELISASKPAK